MRRSGKFRCVGTSVLGEYFTRQRKCHRFASARSDIDGKQTHKGLQFRFATKLRPSSKLSKQCDESRQRTSRRKIAQRSQHSQEVIRRDRELPSAISGLHNFDLSCWQKKRSLRHQMSPAPQTTKSESAPEPWISPAANDTSVRRTTALARWFRGAG